MAPRAAWEACGCPRGEAGIQNIRARGMNARGEKAHESTLQAIASERDNQPAADAVLPATEPIETTATALGVPQKGFRLSTTQLAKERSIMAANKAAYDRAYVAATLEWQQMVLSGKCGRGDSCSDAVATRFSNTLPIGCKKITGRSLKNAVAQDRCGQPPAARGPKRGLPSALVQAVADFATLKQAAGDEQQPRQLARVAKATVLGTGYDALLSSPNQVGYFLKRVREISYISVALREAVDDRRWQYLTSSNLTVWFGGYVDNLVDHKFIPECCRGMGYDPKADPITIAAEILARMLNGDESHQKLSNEGDKRGPRATVYVSDQLGRAGKRTFTYQKHATVLHMVNYNGEASSPHIMLATDAAAAKKGKAGEGAAEAGIRINPEWTFGVPRVRGYFGHDSVQTFEPSYVMNEKGGMEGGGFEEFMKMQIYPKYPNLAPDWEFAADGSVLKGPVFAQFDAGPDRYSEISLSSRIDAYQRGLILFPGLPNGTAANQVCDDLFGVYKTSSAAVLDEIVTERIKAAATDPSVKVRQEWLLSRLALSPCLPSHASDCLVSGEVRFLRSGTLYRREAAGSDRAPSF